MTEKLQKLCDELTLDIQKAYEEQVSMSEAERLAAKFLGAQLTVANALQVADLDARMRKSGLKAIKSQVRVDETKKHEKKPTEGALEDAVNLSSEVRDEQDDFDKAETNVNLLKNYYDTFMAGHVFFRGIAKGNFNG
jgi:hypothetical protein